MRAVRAKRVLRAVTIVCRETEGRETEFVKEVHVCSKHEGGSVNQIICCSMSEGESWTLGAIGVQAFNFLRGREGEGISW